MVAAPMSVLNCAVNIKTTPINYTTANIHPNIRGILWRELRGFDCIRGMHQRCCAVRSRACDVLLAGTVCRTVCHPWKFCAWRSRMRLPSPSPPCTRSLAIISTCVKSLYISDLIGSVNLYARASRSFEREKIFVHWQG